MIKLQDNYYRQSGAFCGEMGIPICAMGYGANLQLCHSNIPDNSQRLDARRPIFPVRVAQKFIPLLSLRGF